MNFYSDHMQWLSGSGSKTCIGRNLPVILDLWEVTLSAHHQSSLYMSLMRPRVASGKSIGNKTEFYLVPEATVSTDHNVLHSMEKSVPTQDV